jgi:hypothetical protein
MEVSGEINGPFAFPTRKEARMGFKYEAEWTSECVWTWWLKERFWPLLEIEFIETTRHIRMKRGLMAFLGK